MKRINPTTGIEFKFGDVRADGFVFYKYRNPLKIKKDGFYLEHWLSKKAFEKQAKNRIAWQKSNPNSVKKYIKNWVKENPVNVAKTQKRWVNNNLKKVAAFSAKRRSAKKLATLSWITKKHLEEIEEFYTIAKMFQMYTGQEYHVDHIEPLKGKTVSGLHAPWNLQILSAKDNLIKGNRRGV